MRSCSGPAVYPSPQRMRTTHEQTMWINWIELDRSSITGRRSSSLKSLRDVAGMSGVKRGHLARDCQFKDIKLAISLSQANFRRGSGTAQKWHLLLIQQGRNTHIEDWIASSSYEQRTYRFIHDGTANQGDVFAAAVLPLTSKDNFDQESKYLFLLGSVAPDHMVLWTARLGDLHNIEPREIILGNRERVFATQKGHWYDFLLSMHLVHSTKGHLFFRCSSPPRTASKSHLLFQAVWK